MADAVVTMEKVAEIPFGNGWAEIYDFSTDDGDYVVGGLSATIVSAGTKIPRYLRQPDFTIMVPQYGYFYNYDRDNGVFLIRAQTSGPTEDDPLGELAAAQVPLLARGPVKCIAFWFNRFP